MNKNLNYTEEKKEEKRRWNEIVIHENRYNSVCENRIYHKNWKR